jgi:hypothetical protein
MIKDFKIIFPLFALFIFLFSSCKRDKFDEQIPFVTSVEIPAGLGTVLTYNFPLGTVDGTTLAISSARPNQIQLYIEQGEANFDFVRQAFLYIETDSSQTEVGYVLENPINNRSVLVMLPDLVDIRELITQPNFRMLLKLNLRYSTVSTSRLRVELGVGVKY